MVESFGLWMMSLIVLKASASSCGTSWMVGPQSQQRLIGSECTAGRKALARIQCYINFKGGYIPALEEVQGRCYTPTSSRREDRLPQAKAEKIPDVSVGTSPEILSCVERGS